MCNDFSCIVTKSHKVIWERGISSHDALHSKYLEQYPELKESARTSVKVEITPTKGYLYPNSAWNFQIDEEDTPDWWSAAHELEAIRANKQWQKEAYALINIEEARKPINPLKGKGKKPTAKDIALLQKWASVRDSVWASVWDSVGDSVRNSVWDSVWDSVGASVRDSVGASVGASVWGSVWASVWASVRDSVGYSVRASVWDSVWDSVWASVWDSVRVYDGSLFYIWGDNYKYQSCVDLWKRGFAPSFDGTTWRLHSGKDAEVVYEWVP